jgi:hypothetical protein
MTGKKAGYTGYLSEAMGKECISIRQRRMSQLGTKLPLKQYF